MRTTLDEVLTNFYKKTLRVDGNTPDARKEAKQALLKWAEDLCKEVIGEDELLHKQSEFDKIDVKHLETDRYPGLDGVRQASRNILRAYQRTKLLEITKRSE